LSFGRVLSETTQAIQQGAFRRGANMGMMSVEHPDILKFMHAKRGLGALTNFNLSVKIPDAFMRRMKENPSAPHVVVNPRTKKRYVIPRSANIDSCAIYDLMAANEATEDCYTVGEVWNMIVRNAHATGEPGVWIILHRTWARSRRRIPAENSLCYPTRRVPWAQSTCQGSSAKAGMAWTGTLWRR